MDEKRVNCIVDGKPVVDRLTVCVAWECKRSRKRMSAQRNAIPVYFPDEKVWKWMCGCVLHKEVLTDGVYGDVVWTSGDDLDHVPLESVDFNWFIFKSHFYEVLGRYSKR